MGNSDPELAIVWSRVGVELDWHMAEVAHLCVEYNE